MNCPHCFQPVRPGSAFCPHCGARLAEKDSLATVMEAVDDPAYGALARANLLRLRGDWNGARALTVDVLREYPNSGNAHSLLGDIHADQGMDEEAGQWYRMALELEPDNAADARKLAAAEARLKAKEAEKNVEAPETPSRFSSFRVLAVAGGVFLAAVIILGFLLKNRTAATPDTGAPLGSSRATGVYTNGPPATAGTGRGSLGPSGATAVPPPAPVAQTDRETALVNGLKEVQAAIASNGLKLAAIQVDPQTQTATLTLDGSAVNGAALDWESRVYLNAVSVAKAVLKADTGVGRATVRVVMPIVVDAGRVTDVAFSGDMDRIAGAQGAAALPLDFNNKWWHAGLTPPAAIAAPSTPVPSAPDASSDASPAPPAPGTAP